MFSRSRALLVLPCPSVYNPVLLFPTCCHGTCERPLRIWVLPTALFLTSKEQDTVPVRWRRKSTECSYKLRSCRYSYRAYPGSKIASKRFFRQWPRMMRKSRILKKWLGDSWLALPHWKQMQRPSPVDLARQDLGTYSDIAMAPQPLGLSGPMAQGHLMTIETQYEDLIRSEAPKMNHREVPFYYGSLVNNTIKGLQSGSIPFGKSLICWHVTNLLGFIAKQVPCQSGLFLKHEANVTTLLFAFRMMVFLMQPTVPHAAPIQISLSANPNQLKTERLENNLRFCGELADQLVVLFPDGDDEGAFIVPALDARSQVLSIKDRRSGIGKPMFKLAPLGSGQIPCAPK